MNHLLQNEEDEELLCVPNPLKSLKNLNPSSVLLCGPGPVNIHPRVYAAMTLPQLGHMDSEFLQVCDDVKHLLQYVWQTNNNITFPITASASGAWECAVSNLTIPGDVHLVCVNGYFGERHCDMALRHKAVVKRIEKPWGEVFSLEEIKEGILKEKPQLLWVCYGETSTGTRQPIEGIGELCRQNNCLFMLDTVSALCAAPLLLDKSGVDVCYSAAQKCLSAPPGISLITFSERALKKIQERKHSQEIDNWYFDLLMLQNYIVRIPGKSSVYHHTAPISLVYALREALTLIAEEGIGNVWKRHYETSELFWKIIEDMGLEMLVKNKEHRLASLHTVKVPPGVDGTKVISHLRKKYNIEIAGGLGHQLAGKVWRIGFMGYNSNPSVVLTVTSALKDALTQQGWMPNKKI